MFFVMTMFFASGIIVSIRYQNKVAMRQGS